MSYYKNFYTNLPKWDCILKRILKHIYTNVDMMGYIEIFTYKETS
jgi:hypothetical protein